MNRGSTNPDRRARKKERTRSEIYRAAMKLFAERDFESVTIEAICQAADVGRGTFFLHFPTKSALLYEFSRIVAREFGEQLTEPRASAPEELAALAEQLSERMLSHADVMSAMVREFSGSTVAIIAAQREASELPDLIEQIIRRGQERGEFRKTVHARMAAGAFLSVTGAIFATSAAILSGELLDTGGVTPDDVRRQYLEIALHGLIES